MRMIPYPALGERLYEARLSSGLLVRVVPKPGFAKTYAFLAVDYGSIDSTFAVDGNSQPLNIQDNVRNIFSDTRNYRKFMQNAVNFYCRYGAALQ